MLTATHQVSVGGDGGGGGGGNREGGREGGGGTARSRTLGNFRWSSSVRDDAEITKHSARRRRHCPRKSHRVVLEIGRAQAGSDLVLVRHEGDRRRDTSFRMKDVFRVEQKKTKGKRDGRLHVTLSATSGCNPATLLQPFYRYRLDFPDEAACARAADAMLEHRSYKAPTAIKLRVCTWNMGNALPQVRALRRAHCTRTAHAHAPHTYTCTRALRAMLRLPQADLAPWLGPCHTSYGSTCYFRQISRRGWAATPTCMPWEYRRRACTTEEAALLHPLTMLHP